MCDICRPVLGRYGKLHPGLPCPLEKALFCTLCATHGHSPRRCKEVALRAMRTCEAPVEDPVPPTKTHIEEPTWLEVADHEPTIRATLVANGIQPMICQQKGREQQRDYRENVKRLQLLCSQQGRRLVLVKEPVAGEGAGEAVLTAVAPKTKSKKG